MRHVRICSAIARGRRQVLYAGRTCRARRAVRAFPCGRVPRPDREAQAVLHSGALAASASASASKAAQPVLAVLLVPPLPFAPTRVSSPDQ